ncbi:MAG TPA: polyprenyl synthetase family protein, partial [Pyrinomonadaceae bacterium]|nr:polyprenyl synthetase family protein [Pyrinomonadaceae bacterium]
GTCGAIIAGADQEEVQAINEYAGNVGLLFQITDDLLDITSSVEAMGKTPGKDERSRKATYPALYGIESTHEHLTRVHDAACSALAKLNRPTGLLREIADYIVERDA